MCEKLKRLRFYRLMQIRFRMAAKRSVCVEMFQRFYDCEKHYTDEKKRLLAEIRRDGAA